MLDRMVSLFEEIKSMEVEEKIKTINKIKLELHKISPMNTEPVDCVLWVKNDTVYVTLDFNREFDDYMGYGGGSLFLKVEENTTIPDRYRAELYLDGTLMDSMEKEYTI